MKRIISDDINSIIMDHQLAATDWKYNSLAWELRWWIDLFNITFFKNQKLPMPVITFEKARVTTLGHYRIGRNDWAVREQINMNKLHLNRPLWDILATLLHEMVHSWEYTYLPKEQRTKNWYHTKTFRQKLESFGILCNEKGAHYGIVTDGRFAWLLRQHAVKLTGGINFSAGGLFVPLKPEKKRKGKSKLKKWSCGCGTNVRVAIADFEAKCLKCGNKFELAD